MVRVVALLLLCISTCMSACNKLPCEQVPDRLQTVFKDDTFQLTGVAISPSGRLFTNYPLWSSVYKYAVVETGHGAVQHDGSAADWLSKQPYPNLFMNSWHTGDDGKSKWVCVQSVVTDEQNYLWVVDPAAPFMGTVYQNSHKLVKINLATNAIEKTYFFDGVADEHSYLNDVRIDNQR